MNRYVLKNDLGKYLGPNFGNWVTKINSAYILESYFEAVAELEDIKYYTPNRKWKIVKIKVTEA